MSAKENRTRNSRARADAGGTTKLKTGRDTEKLNLSLPKCEGKNCPEISIERLNSNQAFIDHFIDQKIIQELAQILEIAPQQAASEAAAIENDSQ